MRYQTCQIFVRFVPNWNRFLTKNEFSDRVFPGPDQLAVVDYPEKHKFSSFGQLNKSLICAPRPEKALVVGCTLMLVPDLTMQLHDLGLLGDDGTCRSFDAKGGSLGRCPCLFLYFISFVYSERVRPLGWYLRLVHRGEIDGTEDLRRARQHWVFIRRL